MPNFRNFIFCTYFYFINLKIIDKKIKDKISNHPA